VSHTSWIDYHISCLQLDFNTLNIIIKRTLAEQKPSRSPVDGIAFMRDRMEVVRRIVLERPAMDPVVLF